MTPLDLIDYKDMIEQNRLGSNVGNLVYAYSIYKTLMTDRKVEFIPTKYKYDYSQAEVDRFNEECDCFVIPLADAVRTDFVKEMKGLTRLVKSLRIPCYIIGIGIRAPYEPGSNFAYPFDNDVKEFLKAVLEKSSIIGIRGIMTADYFSRLGFKEERDFTVIGCPSMYMFGKEGIKIRDNKITKNSVVAYNENTMSPVELSEFIRENAKRFEKRYFIPQQVKELKVMYAGVPYTDVLPEGFPCKITDEVYLKGKCRFFGNVSSWIEFMKSIDFCFGSRLHGNIVATLAGTPSILFPFDARARELAEYHRLTYIPYDEFNGQTGILELAERMDFHSPEKCQEDNFDHFVDFLDQNGIEHIYKDGTIIQSELEVMQYKKGCIAPLTSITQVPTEDIAERLQAYHTGDIYKTQSKIKQLEDQVRELKKKLKEETKRNNIVVKELEKKVQSFDKIIKMQEKQLNYKSVRGVMKVRNIVAKTGIIQKIKSVKNINLK